MNIRLGKNLRIRLDEEDTANWQNDLQLAQTFKLGSMTFQVSICMDTTAAESLVHSENQKLIISLTPKDCETLFSHVNKNDITVGEIRLELDHWSKNKRSRFEEKQLRDKGR